MITFKEVREWFSYTSESGEFIWKKSKGRILAGAVAGNLNCNSYRTVMYNGKNYLVHRLIWLYTYGYLPETSIDHINHIRGDNRVINLRLASKGDNSRNMSKFKTNTSGITGVYWCKNRSRWASFIWVSGKRKSLGRFINKGDAIKARKDAEKLYNYHPNHGNDNKSIYSR